MLAAFRCSPILSVLAVVLLASGAAQANSLLPENGTVTSFDVGSQQIAFEWDQNSVYEIVGTEVRLFQHGISFPSCLPVDGTFYAFVIPNFYDPLPKKTIDITMVGANPSANGAELPRVLFIVGLDSPYESHGFSVPVFGSYVSGTPQPELVTETWEMFPNPDWEVVKIFVPSAFELASIEIETQSIPEPGTVALLVAGLFGLGVAGRRRH